MIVVEYTLTGAGRIPDFISDGGYWRSIEDPQKLIGVGVEGSVPDSLKTFTLEELQARQRAIQAIDPMKKVVNGTFYPHSENFTDDEMDAKIKEWWDARS